MCAHNSHKKKTDSLTTSCPARAHVQAGAERKRKARLVKLAKKKRRAGTAGGETHYPYPKCKCKLNSAWYPEQTVDDCGTRSYCRPTAESLAAGCKEHNIFFSVGDDDEFELMSCLTAIELEVLAAETKLAARQSAWHIFGGSGNAGGTVTSHASFTCGTGLNSYVAYCNTRSTSDFVFVLGFYLAACKLPPVQWCNNISWLQAAALLIYSRWGSLLYTTSTQVHLPLPLP